MHHSSHMGVAPTNIVLYLDVYSQLMQMASSMKLIRDALRIAFPTLNSHYFDISLEKFAVSNH